jgi:ubiquitin-protein ligase
MALKKLNKELKALEGELPENCTCGPKGDDMMNWQGEKSPGRYVS